MSAPRPELERALVVYPFLPHYRAGIFEQMDKSNRVEYTFGGDPSGSNGIAVIDPSSLGRVIQMHTRRVGRLTWQRGAVARAFRGSFDTYIFLGDAAILSTWLAASAARLRRKKVYFWTIGWHRPEVGLRKRIRLAFYRLADGLLLYGNLGRELGLMHGYPANRMHVIYNSHISGAVSKVADETSFEQISAMHFTGAVVGAVIRLNSPKNLHLLIEAASILRSRGKSVTILLAGDGPMRPRLAHLAKERGVDLRLLGAIYSPDALARFYESLDVCVVPSAVGLTAIQSLSHGIPVISDDDDYSQMPEVEAIRPGVTGERYEAGNVSALADAMSAWIGRSERERASISLGCRKEVESRWSPATQLVRIEEAIGANDSIQNEDH